MRRRDIDKRLKPTTQREPVVIHVSRHESNKRTDVRQAQQTVQPVKHPKSLPRKKHIKSYKRPPIPEAPNGGKRLAASHRTRRSFVPQSHKARRKGAAKMQQRRRKIPNDRTADNEDASNAARPRNFRAQQRRSEGVVKAQQRRNDAAANARQRKARDDGQRQTKAKVSGRERNEGQRKTITVSREKRKPKAAG